MRTGDGHGQGRGLMDRRRFLYVAGGAAGAGVGGLGYATFIEPRRVQFTSQPLPRGRGDTIPIASVAQISDLHLKDIGHQHEEVAAEVVRRSPDVIMITGDSVDSSHALPILEDFLSLLPYAIPKYAILGNWEHWGAVDMTRLSAVYERANCGLLVNRSAEHRTGRGIVQVSGVDDLVGGSPEIETVLRSVRDPDLHVLLAHCPAHRDLIPSDTGPVDLILSGHTHGGQVQILGHAPVVPAGSGRYLEGWYHKAGPSMYVSRGIGMSVLPVRFGARPEVSFFESTLGA